MDLEENSVSTRKTQGRVNEERTSITLSPINSISKEKELLSLDIDNLKPQEPKLTIKNKGSLIKTNIKAKESQRTCKDMTLTIGCWNARSLNSIDKVKAALKMNYDITLLQEIWSPSQTTLNMLEGTTYFSKLRRDGYGGTMIIINNHHIKALNIPIQINEDSEILKINVGGDRNLWIMSLYINKKSRKNLLNCLAEVQNIVPQKEWPYLLIGGDWNTNIQDKDDKVTQTLSIICKNMGLTIASCNCLRGQNELDYFIHGGQIKIQEKGVLETDQSDHNSAWIKLKTEAPLNSIRHTIIPNRKLADKITQMCLNNCQNGSDFLKLLDKKYKYNKLKIEKKVRLKPKKNEILDRVLNSNEDDDTFNIVKEYWKEKAEECENDLLTGRLNKAFNFLKTVTKYHEFKRRDGSIINKVKKPDGTVETDQNTVNKLVLDHLKTVQTSQTEPVYATATPFPSLETFSPNGMNYILSKIFHGKAIAFDGMSDIIFTPHNKPITAEKLASIWKSNPKEHYFNTRLIPLNKVHPEIPTSKDCRPIAVNSALVKLLESRVRKRLEDYMVEKLHRGQTGFVPGMGITINQMRLVQRVKEITNSKRHCFGLFIDFSSAYNTILHTKLFERLEKTLPKEEIQLIKAIYSRTKIRLGTHSFTPNIGVAQGSIISPFLFNIYTEDLYETLEKEADVPYGDLMGYADDLLIICTSPYQLRNCISTIKKWSIENNLLLNSKKSGIIEFLPRTKTYPLIFTPGSLVDGIPIVTEYKYLGLVVDQKLTSTKQLAFIEEKTNHQCAALWPLLKAFSLTERMNLWTIICRPLFEMLIFPYYAERSTTNTNKVHSKIRRTFKKFCLLKKNVDNETVEKLMNYNFQERAGKVVEITLIKWNARMKHQAPNPQEFPKEETSPTHKTWFPRETAELINLKKGLCKECQLPCNSYHLSEHGIKIPTNEEILQLMKEGSNDLRNSRGLSKMEILKTLGERLQPFINSIKTILM